MNILKKLLGVFTGFGCIVYISMIFTEKEKVPFVIAAIIFALFTFLLFRPKKIDTTKQQTVVAEIPHYLQILKSVLYVVVNTRSQNTA